MLRRFSEPRQRFGPGHTNTPSITTHKRELRLSLALQRRFAIPPHRLDRSLLNRTAIPNHRFRQSPIPHNLNTPASLIHHPKIDLRRHVPLFRRAAIPSDRFRFVLHDPTPLGIQYPERSLRLSRTSVRRLKKPTYRCVPPALPSRSPIPDRRLLDVLHHAVASLIHRPKLDLRRYVPLLRREVIPPHSFRVILRYTVTLRKNIPQGVLRIDRPLLRGAAIPPDCFEVILRHATPRGISTRQQQLRLNVPLLRGAAIPLHRCIFVRDNLPTIGIQIPESHLRLS